MSAAVTIDAALRHEQYDLVALRLLLGLLVAMRETAPAAREALIAELTPGRRGPEASR